MDECTKIKDDTDFHKTYIALFDSPVQQYIHSLPAKHKRSLTAKRKSKEQTAPDFEIVFEKLNQIYFCLNGKIMGKDESEVIIEYDFDGLALIDGKNARTFWQEYYQKEYYQKEQGFTFKFKVFDGFLNQTKSSGLEKEFCVHIQYEDEYLDVLSMLYIKRDRIPTACNKEYSLQQRIDFLKANKKNKELLLEVKEEEKLKREMKHREHETKHREAIKNNIRDNLQYKKLKPAKKIDLF